MILLGGPTTRKASRLHSMLSLPHYLITAARRGATDVLAAAYHAGRMHDASPGGGAEMMIMSKPMVEAGSTLDRLCSMRLTGLLGLMPTGLCVLSSSWALALMLFAWLAGSVRLAMRICGGSVGGLRGGPRSPKHSNARGPGRGQSHTV